ncbi:MAG TPA: tripartite tricarboxylate transporter substrate-binding protein, partial [Reyranella sp.]|nr:tripartite tricarboxylate transporter substrate-binding protein [Reyranella sp.]
GSGSASTRISGELLKAKARIDMVHVPYKSTPAALQDTMAGHVQMCFTDPVTGLPQVKAGTVRCLGVGHRGRYKLTPELPTLIEQGIPDFELMTWTGVLFPKGIPQPIFTLLRDAIVKTIAGAGLRRAPGRRRLRDRPVLARGDAPDPGRRDPALSRHDEDRRYRAGIEGSEPVSQVPRSHASVRPLRCRWHRHRRPEGLVFRVYVSKKHASRSRRDEKPDRAGTPSGTRRRSTGERTGCSGACRASSCTAHCTRSGHKTYSGHWPRSFARRVEARRPFHCPQ